VGDGATAACCCTCAERGLVERGVSALRIAGRSPGLGLGACSFAPGGRCPVGRPSDAPGNSGVAPALVAAGGVAAAAAPVQGSAMAGGGAMPAAMTSPSATADAIDTEPIRRRGDMSHLPGAGRRNDVGSGLM